jgi:hypothetical protein
MDIVKTSIWLKEYGLGLSDYNEVGASADNFKGLALRIRVVESKFLVDWLIQRELDLI